MNYRRNYVPGATFFFTVVTFERIPFLCDERARRILRESIKACGRRWPFTIDSIVLLPDHLHCIWTLPPNDADFSKRWGWIKKEFTKTWIGADGRVGAVSPSKKRERRQGVWQPKFWEHTMRDDEDYVNHVDYIHYNPVKHGHVRSPADWPWSSFHRYVRMGAYPPDWASPDFLHNPDANERLSKTIRE